MSVPDVIYPRLPVWAQHLAVSAYGLYWKNLRFGRGYGRALKNYLERDGFTQEQWAQWQKAEVERLLGVAGVHVPYYRDTWTPAEKKAARAAQLESLPLLEKDPIRTDPERFLREDRRVMRRLIFHTSGSTGTPIASIWTVGELRDSLALREARSARWAGISFAMPRATISGRMVEPDPESSGPFYRYNAVERQAYLSAFHIRSDTAEKYVDALRRHRVRWLTGYAVSYYLLAKHILDQQIAVPPLEAVITTSEKVTSEMREVMEAAYGCRVYEEYSTVENALFASECAHGRLHVSPDVAVVEILRPDGTACEPGEVGEVVATCLSRTQQPFIRYRLGDMASWDPEPCPCGREMPVIKEVVGRIEDVVVTPDGRRMVRFHGIFVDQPHVQEGQIVQERVDKLVVRVVPAGDYGPPDEADIIRRMRQRLGPDVDIDVECVDRIPRTKAGKFPAVVSRLRSNGAVQVERTGIEST